MKAHTNKTPTSNDTNIKKAIVYFPFMVVIFVICVFSSIAASKLEKSRPSLEQVGNDKYARPGYNVAKSAGSVGDSGDENSEFDNDYILDASETNGSFNFKTDITPADVDNIELNTCNVFVDDGFDVNLYNRNLEDFELLDNKIKKAFYQCNFRIFFVKQHENGSNCGGIFDNKAKEIRIYDVDSVPCLLHEMGHFVDWNIGIRDNGTAIYPSISTEWADILDRDEDARDYVAATYDFDSSSYNYSEELFRSESYAIYFELYYLNPEYLQKNHPEIYDFIKMTIAIF